MKLLCFLLKVTSECFVDFSIHHFINLYLLFYLYKFLIYVSDIAYIPIYFS